jgi:hypothetical protein
VPLGDVGVLLGGVEALLVEVAQVGRLEDRDVHRARLEEVVHEVVLAVALELLQRPHVLLGTEVAVVVVEAVDEPLAVLVGLVLRTGVPEVDVAVDHEVAVAVALEHGASSAFGTSRRPPRGPGRRWPGP